MSDATPAKPKKTPKPKKAATHPKYIEMIKQAISSLKERGGSSRQAILKYIVKNFNVGSDEKGVNARLKVALKSGVTKGVLKQAKGTGASGSFRIGEAVKTKKPKASKPKAAKAKKPKAKKPAGEKKAKAKKVKTPKKKAAAKPKKSPAKKAPKPKKSPAKKPAKKAKSPKKPAKKAAKK